MTDLEMLLKVVRDALPDPDRTLLGALADELQARGDEEDGRLAEKLRTPPHDYSQSHPVNTYRCQAWFWLCKHCRFTAYSRGRGDAPHLTYRPSPDDLGYAPDVVPEACPGAVAGWLKAIDRRVNEERRELEILLAAEARERYLRNKYGVD